MKANRIFFDLGDVLHFEGKGNLYGKLSAGENKSVFETADGYIVTIKFDDAAEDAEVISIKDKGKELIETFQPWKAGV